LAGAAAVAAIKKEIEETEEKSGRLASTTCGHVFCEECIQRQIKENRMCPVCRKKLALKDMHPLFL